MDIKTLVKIEHESYKKRLMDETEGMYVLIYMGFLFVIGSSALYGFRNSPDDRGILAGLAVNTLFLYQSATIYLSYVKENGRRTNIFEKYIYVPVDLAMLRRAKLINAAGSIVAPVLLGQAAAVGIRIADPDHQGGGLLDISVYLPLIIGVLFLVCKAAEYWWLCKKAFNK